VHKSGLVGFAQSGSDADRVAQKNAWLHWPAGQACQRFAARILEHQHDATIFAHELERPHGPDAIKLVPKFVFSREPFECQGWRAIRDELNRQDRLRLAPDPRPRSTTKNAFAISP
jgi:hypothetical protein